MFGRDGSGQELNRIRRGWFVIAVRLKLCGLPGATYTSVASWLQYVWNFVKDFQFFDQHRECLSGVPPWNRSVGTI